MALYKTPVRSISVRAECNKNEMKFERTFARRIFDLAKGIKKATTKYDEIEETDHIWRAVIRFVCRRTRQDSGHA